MTTVRVRTFAKSLSDTPRRRELACAASGPVAMAEKSRGGVSAAPPLHAKILVSSEDSIQVH